MKLRQIFLFLSVLTLPLMGQAKPPRVITPPCDVMVAVQVTNPVLWSQQVRLTYFYQGQFVTLFSQPNNTGRAYFVLTLPWYSPGALFQTNTQSLGSVIATSGIYHLAPIAPTQLLITI